MGGANAKGKRGKAKGKGAKSKGKGANAKGNEVNAKGKGGKAEGKARHAGYEEEWRRHQDGKESKDFTCAVPDKRQQQSRHEILGSPDDMLDGSDSPDQEGTETASRGVSNYKGAGAKGNRAGYSGKGVYAKGKGDSKGRRGGSKGKRLNADGKGSKGKRTGIKAEHSSQQRTELRTIEYHSQQQQSYGSDGVATPHY